MAPPSECLRIVQGVGILQAMILTTMPAVRLEAPRAPFVVICFVATMTYIAFGERSFQPSADLLVEILWLVL